MWLPRSTKLKVMFAKISYRTGTRFNPQEKLTHFDEDKENVDKIERAGIFAEDTLINVQESEQHIIAAQPKTKQKNQTNKKKSFFGWRKDTEEKIEEKDPEITENLVPK